MGAWSTYEARLGIFGDLAGDPRREVSISRAQAYLKRKIVASPSFHTVTVDGREYGVSITDTEELNIKTAVSLPGETLRHGAVLEWSDTGPDTFWLVTEVDLSNGVYAKSTIQRCNYILKWIDDYGNVISRWVIVEDGTKYLIGEKSADIMTVGDARIAVTVGKDKDTNKLVRGQRFLIDDLDSPQVLAYEITKPNKLYSVYNGEGVFRFILNEVNLTDNDNVELRIADYYSWRPKKEKVVSDVQTGETVAEIVTDAMEEKEAHPEEIEAGKGWL